MAIDDMINLILLSKKLNHMKVKPRRAVVCRGCGQIAVLRESDKRLKLT